MRLLAQPGTWRLFRERGICLQWVVVGVAAVLRVRTVAGGRPCLLLLVNVVGHCALLALCAVAAPTDTTSTAATPADLLDVLLANKYIYCI